MRYTTAGQVRTDDRMQAAGPDAHGTQPGRPLTASPQGRALVMRMREGREVPCFIVAAQHLGRRALVNDYVRQYHRLSEVLWLDGSTPAFADGLASGVLVQHLERLCEGDCSDAQLLVIDDLGHLEEDEAERLSDCLDKLVENGWETIVVTTPLHDGFANLQSDRTLITGAQLVEACMPDDQRREQCVRAFLASGIPSEVRLLAVLMLLMQHGSMDELRELGYVFSDDTAPLLNELCPLFEFDPQAGLFAIPGIELSPLRAMILEAMEQHYELHLNSRLGDVEDMAGIWNSRTACHERLSTLSLHLRCRDDMERSCEVAVLASEQLEYAASQSLAGSNLEPKLDGPWFKAAMPRFITAMPGEEGLHIRLFGDLQVWRSRVRIDDPQLRRSKVRRLMVYMALAGNRGIARATLLEHLWPNMDIEHALGNFYVTWSRLNRILGTHGSMEEHYLHSNGQVCRLDMHLVSTDVEQFEDLAQNVILGDKDDTYVFEALHAMEQIHCAESLGGLRDDPFLASQRLRLTNLHVDALLSAAVQSADKGNQSNSLWFARKASDLDPAREDVCQQLMRAQISVGQRTSAIKTYFACKRFLTDELGIMPSSKTTQLYQELLLDRS